MLKKIDVETKVGGICAIIAIVAGIFEMAFNGFTADIIAGGIKDIFGTLVAVLVLVVAVNRIKSKNYKTFQGAFLGELEKISNKFSPLIVRASWTTPGDEASERFLLNNYRFNLLTDFEKIFVANSDESEAELKHKIGYCGKGGMGGKFVDLKKDKPNNAIFTINKSTFGRGKSDSDFETIKRNIADKFSSRINAQYGDFCDAKPHKEGISVEFRDESGLETVAQAVKLASLIEYVLILCIIEN